MRKLLFGMGALTWMVINLAIIYWIGRGAAWLITQSLGSFLGHLALGLVMIFFLILLSFLSIGLIGMVFDDHDKWLERLSRWFPFMNLN
jgi:hypothetical protein